MRLAQAVVLGEGRLKQLSAGGPGSGRHPEGGGKKLPTPKTVHHTALAYGFELAPHSHGKPEGTYYHAKTKTYMEHDMRNKKVVFTSPRSKHETVIPADRVAGVLHSWGYKDIRAGGPGSGRHPEGNGNGSGAAVKKMQEHLEKAGFKHEGRGVYSHPDKGKVSVYDSGAFHHVASPDKTKSEGVNQLSGRPGNGLEMLRRRISAAKKASGSKCPHCGSTKHVLMPTDFETAKCKDCGKTFEINAGKKELIKEHERLVDRLEKKDPAELEDEEEKQEKELAQMKAGGPGSGRHPEGGSKSPGVGKHAGTGMSNEEFGKFAERVGMARNANRAEEDRLRRAGNHDEANKIYEVNKIRVKQMLDEAKVSPKAFDDHMKQYAKAAGLHTRNVVKMARVYGGF